MDANDIEQSLQEIASLLLLIHEQYLSLAVGPDVLLTLCRFIEDFGLHHKVCVLHIEQYRRNLMGWAVYPMSYQVFYEWLRKVAFLVFEHRDVMGRNALHSLLTAYLIPTASQWDTLSAKSASNMNKENQIKFLTEPSLRLCASYTEYFELWFYHILTNGAQVNYFSTMTIWEQTVTLSANSQQPTITVQQLQQMIRSLQITPHLVYQTEMEKIIPLCGCEDDSSSSSSPSSSLNINGFLYCLELISEHMHHPLTSTASPLPILHLLEHCLYQQWLQSILRIYHSLIEIQEQSLSNNLTFVEVIDQLAIQMVSSILRQAGILHFLPSSAASSSSLSSTILSLTQFLKVMISHQPRPGGRGNGDEGKKNGSSRLPTIQMTMSQLEEMIPKFHAYVTILLQSLLEDLSQLLQQDLALLAMPIIGDYLLPVVESDSQASNSMNSSNQERIHCRNQLLILAAIVPSYFFLSSLSPNEVTLLPLLSISSLSKDDNNDNKQAYDRLDNLLSAIFPIDEREEMQDKYSGKVFQYLLDSNSHSSSNSNSQGSADILLPKLISIKEFFTMLFSYHQDDQGQSQGDEVWQLVQTLQVHQGELRKIIDSLFPIKQQQHRRDRDRGEQHSGGSRILLSKRNIIEVLYLLYDSQKKMNSHPKQQQQISSIVVMVDWLLTSSCKLPSSAVVDTSEIEEDDDELEPTNTLSPPKSSVSPQKYHHHRAGAATVITVAESEEDVEVASTESNNPQVELYQLLKILIHYPFPSSAAASLSSATSWDLYRLYDEYIQHTNIASAASVAIGEDDRRRAVIREGFIQAIADKYYLSSTSVALWSYTALSSFTIANQHSLSQLNRQLLQRDGFLTNYLSENVQRLLSLNDDLLKWEFGRCLSVYRDARDPFTKELFFPLVTASAASASSASSSSSSLMVIDYGNAYHWISHYLLPSTATSTSAATTAATAASTKAKVTYAIQQEFFKVILFSSPAFTAAAEGQGQEHGYQGGGNPYVLTFPTFVIFATRCFTYQLYTNASNQSLLVEEEMFLQQIRKMLRYFSNHLSMIQRALEMHLLPPLFTTDDEDKGDDKDDGKEADNDGQGDDDEDEQQEEMNSMFSFSLLDTSHHYEAVILIKKCVKYACQLFDSRLEYLLKLQPPSSSSSSPSKKGSGGSSKLLLPPRPPSFILDAARVIEFIRFFSTLYNNHTNNYSSSDHNNQSLPMLSMVVPWMSYGLLYLKYAPDPPAGTTTASSTINKKNNLLQYGIIPPDPLQRKEEMMERLIKYHLIVTHLYSSSNNDDNNNKHIYSVRKVKQFIIQSLLPLLCTMAEKMSSSNKPSSSSTSSSSAASSSPVPSVAAPTSNGSPLPSFINNNNNLDTSAPLLEDLIRLGGNELMTSLSEQQGFLRLVYYCLARSNNNNNNKGHQAKKAAIASLDVDAYLQQEISLHLVCHFFACQELISAAKVALLAKESLHARTRPYLVPSTAATSGQQGVEGGDQLLTLAAATKKVPLVVTVNFLELEELAIRCAYHLYQQHQTQPNNSNSDNAAWTIYQQTMTTAKQEGKANTKPMKTWGIDYLYPYLTILQSYFEFPRHYLEDFAQSAYYQQVPSVKEILTRYQQEAVASKQARQQALLNLPGRAAAIQSSHSIDATITTGQQVQGAEHLQHSGLHLLGSSASNGNGSHGSSSHSSHSHSNSPRNSSASSLRSSYSQDEIEKQEVLEGITKNNFKHAIYDPVARSGGIVSPPPSTGGAHANTADARLPNKLQKQQQQQQQQQQQLQSSLTTSSSNRHVLFADETGQPLANFATISPTSITPRPLQTITPPIIATNNSAPASSHHYFFGGEEHTGSSSSSGSPNLIIIGLDSEQRLQIIHDAKEALWPVFATYCSCGDSLDPGKLSGPNLFTLLSKLGVLNDHTLLSDVGRIFYQIASKSLYRQQQQAQSGQQQYVKGWASSQTSFQALARSQRHHHHQHSSANNNSNGSSNATTTSRRSQEVPITTSSDSLALIFEEFLIFLYAFAQLRYEDRYDLRHESPSIPATTQLGSSQPSSSIVGRRGSSSSSSSSINHRWQYWHHQMASSVSFHRLLKECILPMIQRHALLAFPEDARLRDRFKSVFSLEVLIAIESVEGPLHAFFVKELKKQQHDDSSQQQLQPGQAVRGAEISTILSALKRIDLIPKVMNEAQVLQLVRDVLPENINRDGPVFSPMVSPTALSGPAAAARTASPIPLPSSSSTTPTIDKNRFYFPQWEWLLSIVAFQAVYSVIMSHRQQEEDEFDEEQQEEMDEDTSSSSESDYLDDLSDY